MLNAHLKLFKPETKVQPAVRMVWVPSPGGMMSGAGGGEDSILGVCRLKFTSKTSVARYSAIPLYCISLPLHTCLRASIPLRQGVLSLPLPPLNQPRSPRHPSAISFAAVVAAGSDIPSRRRPLGSSQEQSQGIRTKRLAIVPGAYPRTVRTSTPCSCVRERQLWRGQRDASY